MTFAELRVRLLLVTVSVATGGAVFEVAVHAVEAARGPIFPGGPRTLSFTTEDPLLGWRHEPDVEQRYGWPEHPEGAVTIRTNGRGLREDAPTPPTPPAGVRRVLVLGDSHTDGLVNNPESWPNVLERLAAERSLSWEVLNAGVTGYQPSQYYLWWRSSGRDLEPDLVLVGYYVGNDVPGAAGPRLSRDPDGAWELDVAVPEADQARRPGVRARLVRLRRDCRTCALVSLLAHRFLLDGPTFEEAGFVRGSEPDERRGYLAGLRHCLGCVWQSLDQPWLLGDDPAGYGHELAATAELFRRLRDEVAEAGAELAVVVIPSKLQVEPGATSRALETAELMGLDGLYPLFEDRVEREVLSTLEELGIQAIQVRGFLTEEHERTGARLYYDGDWHLNVDGSRAVGVAVDEVLSERSRPNSNEGGAG